MDTSHWNSLEAAKLIVSCATPLLILSIGIYVHRVTKRFEHRQWQSQKLTEKRLSIYDDLAPVFNDLLCYFTYIGCWKELTPAEVIALKRTLDKKIYLAAPLFTVEFFAACQHFQQGCFETYNGWGEDPRLKTSFERRRHRDSWQESWRNHFSQFPSDPKQIREAYQDVMREFAKAIGINDSSALPSTGRIPNNIR